MRQWHKLDNQFVTSDKVMDAGLFPAVVFLYLLGFNADKERGGILTDRDVAPRHLVRKVGPLIQSAVEDAWPVEAELQTPFVTEVRMAEWLEALVREGFLSTLAAGGMAINKWEEWAPPKSDAERQRRSRARKRDDGDVTASRGERDGVTVGRDSVTPRERREKREREYPLNPPQGDLGDPSDPEPDPEGAEPEGFGEVLQVVRALHFNGPSFHRDPAIREFLGDGGTVEEAKRLASSAQAQGRKPGNLLVHWMRDPHEWKAVLADLDNAAKEQAIRARDSDAKTVGEVFGEEPCQ